MQPRHLPELDGLRAIAVLLVLWCHVPLDVPGYPEWLRTAYTLVGPGGLGVEIFFVLSGFLITRILLAERERSQPVRWFLLRRMLRIFPIYYLLLLVMAIATPRPEIAWCATYLYNLRAILVPTGDWPLAHTWSLCIEEHYYLLWPLVVAFAPRNAPQRLLWCGVFPLAIASAYWLTTRQPPEHAMMAVQHASPVRFLTLGIGSLLACHETALGRQRLRLGLAAGLLVAALALHPLLLYAMLPYWTGRPPLFPIELTPMVWLVHSACLSTTILLGCLPPATARCAPARLLRFAPLRAVGRISYGLYLYHLPVFHWLLYGRATAGNTALALVVTFAVAGASYLLVERPILRFAARFR